MRKDPVIYVFSGHTGGHLFPALSYSHYLREHLTSSSLVFVTSSRAQEIFSPQTFESFSGTHFLKPFPYPSGVLSKISFFAGLFQACLAVFSFYKKRRPDLVVGFGSYVSFPGVFVAKFMGIPTLIHEQNKVSGKATRWLLPYANKVAYSFPGTFCEQTSKYVESGLPLRSEMYGNVRDKSSGGAYNSRKHLLIIGGSQGAHALNEACLEVFSHLNSEEKEKIAVTHITGKQDFERIKTFYQEQKMIANVHPFFSDMKSVYLQTDFAISRAGANTFFELRHYQIPSLLIPYPYAGAHQMDNAIVGQNEGWASVVKESDLNEKIVREFVQDGISSASRINEMKTKAQQFSNQDARTKLLELTKVLLRSHD